MSSERRAPMAMLAAACALLAACADFSRGPSTAAPADGAAAAETNDAGGAETAAVSFAAAIEPLLLSACRGCHAQGQEAGDTQFVLVGMAAADYATVSRLVNTAAPASSRLLLKMSGNNGHGGGTVFAAGSPQYETVLAWIEQGAPP